MNETAVYYRNKVVHNLYSWLLKPIFFRNDPERVHDKMTVMGISLGNHALGKMLTRSLFNYENQMLKQKILGIDFKNHIGLSAGFDKNGQLTDILPSVGFGFAEIGSVTAFPCEGNPKPRLWRLPESRSLAVYYGLKNDGCETISKRLSEKHFDIPVGVSVAMTNCSDNLVLKSAVKDFAKAFKTMESVGSYVTVNVSCPNAQGGQPFVSPHKFDYLFDVLDEIPTKKPVFVKFSPDLSYSELDALLDVASKHRIDGIVCTNLTKKRDNSRIFDDKVPQTGGLSGKVVQDLADKMLTYIYKKAGKRFILVGSGGVFTAADAYKKIRLGASLVQMITGMIFEGPQVVSEINQGLAKLLARDGFTDVAQAVGVDNCYNTVNE